MLVLATACVRNWTVVMPPHLTLFYSAMEDNLASHRIAQAAGGRQVRRLVRTSRTAPEGDDVAPRSGQRKTAPTS